MKLRILKDPQGNIVATSEIKYDLSPQLTPKEQEGYTLEEVDVDDDYKSDLNSFYKKNTKK